MRFSIYSIALRNYSLEASIRFSSEAGFDAIELRGAKGFHIAPGEYDLEGLSSIKEHLASWGIKLSGIAGYTSLIHPDEESMKKAINEVREWIMLTSELEGDFYRVSVHIPNGVHRRKAFELAIKALRSCIDFCKDYGVKLVLETHGNSLVDNPSDTLKIIEHTDPDYVSITYDPGNWYIIGHTSFKEDIKALARYIVNVHVKDIKKIKIYGLEAYREVLLGEGNIPWDSIIKELAKAGYDGYLCVEYEVIYKFGELLPPTEIGVLRYLIELEQLVTKAL